MPLLLNVLKTILALSVILLNTPILRSLIVLQCLENITTVSKDKSIDPPLSSTDNQNIALNILPLSNPTSSRTSFSFIGLLF